MMGRQTRPKDEPLGFFMCLPAALLGAFAGAMGLPLAYVLLLGVVGKLNSDGLEVLFLVPLGLIAGGMLGYRWARRI